MFGSSVAHQATDLDLPIKKIGEYEITSRLGVGGMGVVYEGRQPLIGKRVAVKVLMPSFSREKELVDRFIAEARAVNEIRHRGIVDIFGFGQLPDGSHYLVMEYLEGEPFDRMIRRRGPMPIDEVLGLTVEILDALDAAHAAGVIHRDIKPSNLFLVNQGRGRTYVKLLDFGIAKLGVTNNSDNPQTRASVIMGTPDYISPEQARGSAISARTDLYALGVVLFELLTGERPFQAENTLATMWMHVEDQPPKASDIRPDIPPQLDELILWAMEKDPANRPHSAEDMRAHVESIRGALKLTSATPSPLNAREPLANGPATPVRRTGTPLPVQLGLPNKGRTPMPGVASGSGVRRTSTAHSPPPGSTDPNMEAPPRPSVYNETRMAPLHDFEEDEPATHMGSPADFLALGEAPVTGTDANAEAGQVITAPQGTEAVARNGAANAQDDDEEDDEVTNSAAVEEGSGGLMTIAIILVVLAGIAVALILRPPPKPGVTIIPHEGPKLPPPPKPNLPRPLETRPYDVKPAEAKPVVSKPSTLKPVEAKPVEAKTAETRLVESKPVESKPLEPKRTEPVLTTKPAPAEVIATEPSPATSTVVSKKSPATPRREITLQQLDGRVAKLEAKLAAHEKQTGESDKIIRTFLEQAKQKIAGAQSESERREALKFLDEIAEQFGN